MSAEHELEEARSKTLAVAKLRHHRIRESGPRLWFRSKLRSSVQRNERGTPGRNGDKPTIRTLLRSVARANRYNMSVRALPNRCAARDRNDSSVAALSRCSAGRNADGSSIATGLRSGAAFVGVHALTTTGGGDRISQWGCELYARDL